MGTVSDDSIHLVLYYIYQTYEHIQLAPTDEFLWNL